MGSWCHLPLSSRSELWLLRACSWPSLPLEVWVELVCAHGFVCAGSVAWSHPTLCSPSNCSLSVSSVHGISQQEYWSGLPFPSPGIFPTQGSNPDLSHCRQILHHLNHWGYSFFKGQRSSILFMKIHNSH